MVAKVLPFQHADKKQTFKLIKKMNPDFSSEKFGDMSKSCVDLISKMLEKDPEYRITIPQALAHPFFDQLDPKNVDSMNSDEFDSGTSEHTMGIEVTCLNNEELKLHEPPTRSASKKMGKGQPTQKPKTSQNQDNKLIT